MIRKRLWRSAQRYTTRDTLAPMAQKAHCIGICGAGMAPTARLLQEAGWEVTGSDAAFYPPASEYVAELGIPVAEGYAAENIPADVDRIVMGRSAKLSPGDNPEVDAALESGVPVQAFAEVVGELIADRHVVVVAGSYGKSTLTALIAHCLRTSGLDVGYFIGAFGNDFRHPAALGSHKLFVIEGDEYPTSHWDQRSKFFHYHAHDLVLTSVVHDHVNVFPTPQDYRKPFIELVNTLPAGGTIVACADERTVFSVLNDYAYTTYGLSEDATWRARRIAYGPETTFTLFQNGTPLADVTTTLLGAHNMQNIAGASAYTLSRELLSPEQFAAAIQLFSGLRRRLDRKTPSGSVPVYEGFGSSYEKARAAYAAVRTHYPDHRVVAVFEPYEFSWRNRDALPWYDTAFEDVDLVVVSPPPHHGASSHQQLTHDEIVERIRESGTNVRAISSAEEGIATLEHELTHDDVLIMMSSGSIGGLIERIPEWVAETYPPAETT